MWANIGKWLVGVVLGWLFEYVKELVEKYRERERAKKARAESNQAAEQKLEEAQSEQEIIDSGAAHLKR